MVNHSFVGGKLKLFKNYSVIEMQQHASIQPDNGQGSNCWPMQNRNMISSQSFECSPKILLFFKMSSTEFDTHMELLYGRHVSSITVTFTGISNWFWHLWFSFDIYKDSEYFWKGLSRFTRYVVSSKATCRLKGLWNAR